MRACVFRDALMGSVKSANGSLRESEGNCMVDEVVKKRRCLWFNESEVEIRKE